MCGFLNIKKARPKVRWTISNIQKRFFNIEERRRKPWPTILNISGRQMNIGNDRINIQKRLPMRCFLDTPCLGF